jgi:hypothetical protein
MNRYRIRPARTAQREVRLSPLERLAQLLAPEYNGSNAELIRRMRAVMFASVDELEKSGRIKLPK